MDRPWRGAVATLLVAVTLAFPTPPARAATRLRVAILGDSVAASIAASIPARAALGGVELALDAQVCRRTTRMGCTWRGTTPVSVRDLALTARGQLGDVAVVVSGYNDDDRRFRADATAALAAMAASGVRRVIWLDLRTPASLPAEAQRRHTAINATLRSLDRASPLLQVASWNAFSAGHDGWFFDPIHLRAAGAVQLARFIAAQVRSASAGPRPDASPAYGRRCAPSNAAGSRLGPLLPGATPAATAANRGRVLARLADTRSGPADGLTRPLGAGRELALAVAGRPGVTQSATAAVVRVTVPGSCATGHVSVGGCGRAPARTFVVAKGRWATATVTVPLGAFGRACVRSTVQTDVVVDLLGWSTTP